MMSPKLLKDETKNKFHSSKVVKLPSGKDYMRIVPKIEIKKNYKK